MKEVNRKCGKLTFLQLDQNCATTCVFHPKERYIFAAGGTEGKVHLYCALLKKILHSLSLPYFTRPRKVNGLAFQPDGEKVAVTCESRRMSIVDVEKNQILITYDNCSSAAPARQPVATHSDVPHLTACLSVNRKGITLFDLRMPLPLDIFSDVYDTPIGDLIFLDKSWPWSSGHASLLSGGGDGKLKTTTIGGRTTTCLPTQMTVSSLVASPGTYGCSVNEGFESVIVTAGDFITCQAPNFMGQVQSTEKFSSMNGHVLRAKYSSSGVLLYTSSQRGSIARYRRYPDHHEAVEELYAHDGAVTDFDLSSYEDFIVSTSSNGSVGLYSLGIPSHGNTQCWELT